MVTNNIAELSSVSWDYVVADEVGRSINLSNRVMRIVQGHKLKNHNTKAAQSMRKLPVAHRLLLTGTPIQVAHA
jgi:SNF2 family DNA or RNA helicase